MRATCSSIAFKTAVVLLLNLFNVAMYEYPLQHCYALQVVSPYIIHCTEFYLRYFVIICIYFIFVRIQVMNNNQLMVVIIPLVFDFCCFFAIQSHAWLIKRLPISPNVSLRKSIRLLVFTITLKSCIIIIFFIIMFHIFRIVLTAVVLLASQLVIGVAWTMTNL